MAEPKLQRALSGHLPFGEVADAVAEALSYAWEHRERVLGMVEPVGYLYRVAQSKSRRPKQGLLQWEGRDEIPEVEPMLSGALAGLPVMQGRAVWLVIGCGFSHREAGEALDVSTSTLSTHVSRGLAALRVELGVHTNE